MNKKRLMPSSLKEVKNKIKVESKIKTNVKADDGIFLHKNELLLSVASIGFGSMAEAVCRNLRDSGVNVVIGARNLQSASIKKAAAENFKIYGISEAIKKSGCVLIAIPDLQIREFFSGTGPELFKNKCLIICHGLSYFYHPHFFPAQCDIILISPNAIANKLRENYLNGPGDYALCSVLNNHSGKALKKLKYICEKLKITKNRMIRSKLKDEVFSDLFAEQSLLVGGILALILSAFETMCEAGIAEEAAYLSTFHEIKYIIESINELGIKEFMEKISDIARMGSIEAFFSSGLKEKIKKEFKKIYTNIESHKFYNEFINSSDKNINNNLKREKYLYELGKILNSRLCNVYDKFNRKNER